MAAPNLATIETITGRTARYAVTDSSGTVLSNSNLNDAVFKVNSIKCANITGSTAETITLTLFDGTTDTHLASTISVPVNGTQLLTSADAYFYLKPGWSIRAAASATASLELLVSYEVLGEEAPLRLWTPADTTSTLWLDAADATTITTVSGRVSTWADKSGNGNNFSQSTAADRPVIAPAELNGLDVMRFENSHYLLSDSPPSTWTFLHSTTRSSLYVVLTNNHGYDTEGVVIATSGSASHVGMNWMVGDPAATRSSTEAQITRGSPSGYYTRNNTDQYTVINDGRPYVISHLIYVNTADWATGGEHRFWMDGTSRVSTSTTSTTGSSAADPSYTAAIGSQPNNGAFPLNGDIMEMIIRPGNDSDEDRQRFEGYLTWRWGRQAALAEGHPYKNAAPMTPA